MLNLISIITAREQDSPLDLEELRNYLGKVLITVTTLAIIPISAFIAYRAIAIKAFDIAFYLHSIIATLAITLLAFRNRFSWRTSVSILLVLLLVAILAGFLRWGLAGTALPASIILAFGVILFFGFKPGFACFAFTLLYAITVAALYSNGILASPIDIDTTSKSAAPWLSNVFFVTYYNFMIWFMTASFNNSLQRSIELLKARIAELKNSNECRQIEIQLHSEIERDLITARENAEEQIRVKDAFLAIMSHELRTPLNPVMGFADLIRHDLPEGPEKKQLAAIHDSSAQLLSRIDEILEYSKIDADTLPLEPEMLTAEDVIGPVMHTAETQTVAKTIEMKHSITENGNRYRFLGDRRRLVQTGVALTNHAFRFTTHGFVEIKADIIPDTNHSGRFEFSVRDTGKGIPADLQNEVYHPFLNHPNEPTILHPRIDLSLALARKLVIHLGGQIGFESEPDTGSHFWCSIPVELSPNRQENQLRSPQTPPPASSRHPTPNRKPHVLLVEDEIANRDLILALLENSNAFTIDWVPNGEKAVLAADQRSYDAILMDIRMPRMSGLEATRSIRQRELKRKSPSRIPIIALTAHVSPDSHEECLAAGMDAYISKPIDFDKLLEILATHMASPAGAAS